MTTFSLFYSFAANLLFLCARTALAPLHHLYYALSGESTVEDNKTDLAFLQEQLRNQGETAARTAFLAKFFENRRVVKIVQDFSDENSSIWHISHGFLKEISPID